MFISQYIISHSSNEFSLLFPVTILMGILHVIGVGSENNQEMTTNPTAVGWSIEQADGGEASFFEKLGADTETKLEDFFQWWGCIMASSPWIVLFFGTYIFLMILFCSFHSHVHIKKMSRNFYVGGWVGMFRYMDFKLNIESVPRPVFRGGFRSRHQVHDSHDEPGGTVGVS